ncbi:hypothetical protein SAFG77S_11867 [Streptomyces afghaniensis]
MRARISIRARTAGRSGLLVRSGGRAAVERRLAVAGRAVLAGGAGCRLGPGRRWSCPCGRSIRSPRTTRTRGRLFRNAVPGGWHILWSSTRRCPRTSGAGCRARVAADIRAPCGGAPGHAAAAAGVDWALRDAGVQVPRGGAVCCPAPGTTLRGRRLLRPRGLPSTARSRRSRRRGDAVRRAPAAAARRSRGGTRPRCGGSGTC